MAPHYTRVLCLLPDGGPVDMSGANGTGDDVSEARTEAHERHLGQKLRTRASLGDEIWRKHSVIPPLSFWLVPWPLRDKFLIVHCTFLQCVYRLKVRTHGHFGTL